MPPRSSDDMQDAKTCPRRTKGALDKWSQPRPPPLFHILDREYIPAKMTSTHITVDEWWARSDCLGSMVMNIFESGCEGSARGKQGKETTRVDEVLKAACLQRRHTFLCLCLAYLKKQGTNDQGRGPVFRQENGESSAASAPTGRATALEIREPTPWRLFSRIKELVT